MNTGKDIYTEQIKAGKRTYFLDVKQTVENKKYLQITESKTTDEGFDRRNVMIFEEDIEKFAEAFVRVLLRMNNENLPKDDKAYSVEKIRQNHGQAYAPWTEDDDNLLEQLFCDGKKTSEIADILKRKSGAIQSRIRKLELKEK